MIPTWAMSNSTYVAGKAPAGRARATHAADFAPARGAKATRSARSRLAEGVKAIRTADFAQASGATALYLAGRSPSYAGNTVSFSAHVVKDRARSKRRMWPAARMLFFLLAFALLFGGFTFMRSFASAGQVPPAAAAESVIVVDTGDTLWSVATAVKQPSMDTRQAVHMLMKRNQLSSATLEAGQLLIIPAEMKPHE